MALGALTLPGFKLGLGLAALGRPGYINLGHAEDLQHDYDTAAMEARCHAVLDAAWAAGIRYFDAARSYGRAEGFLGSWLAKRGIAADAVVVGSKWGYTYTANWQVEADKHEIKDHSLPVFHRQLTQSRANLGTHLRLYQIHSATRDSGVLDHREVLDELARLRDSGLAIGLTLSGPNQTETLQQAMAIQIGGRRLFDAVQATWNVLEPSAGDALRTAHESGMSVIVKEALANGRLTARNTEPNFVERKRILEEIATEHRTTIDAVALAVVLAQPWVDIVLSGAASVEQLASNVQALQVALRPEDQERLTSLMEPASDYWQHRGQLAWN